MSLIEFIDFDVHGDSRGHLVALESDRNIPFEIKRVYYMTGLSSDLPRGFHAHHKLRQIAVCLAGKCRMVMDNGTKRQEVWLDSSSKGLLIPETVWHEMHDFSSDCVLLLLANQYYDERDYIREYKEFVRVSSL